MKEEEEIESKKPAFFRKDAIDDPSNQDKKMSRTAEDVKAW